MKIRQWKPAVKLAKKLHKNYVDAAIARGINISESYDWSAILPQWRWYFIRQAIEYMRINGG